MTTWNRDDSDLSTLTGIASTTVGNLRLTGSTLGHISDTDILTFSANTLAITASNLNLDDSSKLKLGTGYDLEIYHDGSHSYIKDVGTGSLKLSSTDGSIYLNNGSTDTIEFTLADDSGITAPEGTFTIIANDEIFLNANNDIILDSDSGKIELKDNTVEFGSLNNSSGNLLLKSGTTTALTFSGANSQFSGTLQCAINAGDGSSENFVVEQSGLLLKRTATQVRSDLGISDAEIVDWTTDQGGTNIHAGNYDNTQLTDEQVQDKAGAMFTGNTETLITATYQDGDGTIDLVVDNDLSNYDNSSSGFITATLTTEAVQDIVGGMFSGNTETRISATYEDGDGTIDLVADDMTANTMGSGFTVSATTDSNATTITQGDDLFFAAGTGITCTTTADGTVTIANTVSDTNTTYTGGTNLTLDGTEFNVDDAFLKNDADDTMAGTLTIDKDVSNTSADTYMGQLIDVDKTGTSTSDNTIVGLKADTANLTATNGTNIMYGIWNRARLLHDADAGTTTVIGTYNAALGGTNGTSTAIGADIIALGCDTNIGLRIECTDGGSDLKILSSANNNDYCSIAVDANGATTLTTVDNDGIYGNLNFTVDGNVNFDVAGTMFEFDGCAVGFDLETPAYDVNDTDVDFQTGNKQFVTFGSGDITDLNLIFPKTSGNFVLLLKQDGTGSRLVTNYKVWDRSEGTAASGSATVKFAAGDNPTLTTDANHVDIISFFYDCDNEIAYGVASLDFQF